MLNQNLCRICLASNIKMYPIEETYYNDIIEEPLNFNSELPHSVCYMCNAVLIKLYKFLKHMISMNHYLKEIIRSESQLTTEKIDWLKKIMPKQQTLSKVWLNNSNYVAEDTFNGKKLPRELQKFFEDPLTMIEYHRTYEQVKSSVDAEKTIQKHGQKSAEKKSFEPNKIIIKSNTIIKKSLLQIFHNKYKLPTSLQPTENIHVTEEAKPIILHGKSAEKQNEELNAKIIIKSNTIIKNAQQQIFHNKDKMPASLQPREEIHFTDANRSDLVRKLKTRNKKRKLLEKISFSNPCVDESITNPTDTKINIDRNKIKDNDEIINLPEGKLCNPHLEFAEKDIIVDEDAISGSENDTVSQNIIDQAEQWEDTIKDQVDYVLNLLDTSLADNTDTIQPDSLNQIRSFKDEGRKHQTQEDINDNQTSKKGEMQVDYNFEQDNCRTDELHIKDQSGHSLIGQDYDLKYESIADVVDVKIEEYRGVDVNDGDSLNNDEGYIGTASCNEMYLDFKEEPTQIQAVEIVQENDESVQENGESSLIQTDHATPGWYSENHYLEQAISRQSEDCVIYNDISKQDQYLRDENDCSLPTVKLTRLSDEVGQTTDFYRDETFMFHCKKCDYRTLYKQNVIKHLKIHNNAGPLFCLICSSMFKYSDSFARHMYKKHYLKECEVCNEYIHFKRLRKHMEVSHGKKKSVKIYATKSTSTEFNMHNMKTHEKDNDILNSVDKASESQKSQKKTEICKKNQCKICNKSYKYKSCYLKHIKELHLEVKRDIEILEQYCVYNTSQYQCSICNKRYTHKSSCIKHIKYLHMDLKGSIETRDKNVEQLDQIETKFGCSMCDMVFYMKEELSQHVLLHIL